MEPTQPLTARIDWIVGLDGQPALRNLLITQCYHDLSSELTRVLGPQNVNWCTFATWASKTAGRFIRNEEIPKLFRGMLADSAAFKASAARAIDSLKGVLTGSPLPEDSLLDVAEDVAGDVSGQITAGNLSVFSELAPVFARFVALFDGAGGRPDDVAAAALLGSLRVGPSAKGGQSLLREALQQLLAASAERDPRKRAARMLVSNAQTGLHEQIRLQPYIAGSLDAPIADTLGRLLDHHADRHASLADRIHALWDSLSHAVVRDAESVWCDLATRELMTLAVPGQVLHLGSPLPAPPGAKLYPTLLDPVDGSDALLLLEHYDALDPDARGDVGATDWAQLAQRMRYIIALFRSRQCDADLLAQPFDDAQHAAILRGEVPAGPL